jgi:hypothetical protein
MNRLLVDHRQLTGKSGADGTGVDIRFMVESIAAAGTEHLRFR